MWSAHTEISRRWESPPTRYFVIFFGGKIQCQLSEPNIGESLDTKTVCCRAGEVVHHHRRPCRNMHSSDRDDAVTCAGTGDSFQQPRQTLGLLEFSGAGLNSTGTGPRIADGWYTSDAGGVAAQTRTGTKRPAADPRRPAGDGLTLVVVLLARVAMGNRRLPPIC